MKTRRKYLHIVTLLLASVLSTDAYAKTKQRADSYAPVVSKVTPELLRGKIAFRRANVYPPAQLRLISTDGTVRATLPQSFKISPTVLGAAFKESWVTANRQLMVRSTIAPVKGNASLNARVIRVYDLNGKLVREISSWTSQEVMAATPSPDEKYVAYTWIFTPAPKWNPSSDYRVGLARFDGKGDKLLDDWPEAHKGFLSDSQRFIAWGRDSQQLLCRVIGEDSQGNAEEGTLFVTNINGSVVKPYDGDWSQFRLPEVGPDGTQRIVLLRKQTIDGSQREESGLFLENRAGEVRTLKTGQISNALWSSDGKWISFQMPSASGTVLCVIQPDGRNFRVLLRDLPAIDHFWMPS